MIYYSKVFKNELQLLGVYMQQSNEFFATARPGQLYFRVAMPGMISMLAMSLYSIIEGIIIGQLLGEAAFAGVNIAMPFVMINFCLADLIGVGSSVPISIALGRQERDKANNIFTCSLIMIILTSMIMGVILFFSSPFLVGISGAEGALASLAVEYVRVYAIMGPVTTLIFAMDNYLRICGFVKGSMLLNIFMSCLTAFLIYIFIAVVGMNAEGSALATSLAMAFCALIALIPFLLKKTILRFVRPRFSFAMIKQIVLCGSPVFLNNISGRVASIVMNGALFSAGGETAVASYAVLMYAGGIIEPMLYGMSDSVQPAIGYNWGAGMLKRVRDIAKYAFFATGVVSVIGTAVMFFFARPIVCLFVDAVDIALINMSVGAMKIFCFSFLFRWFGFAVQGFYSAIERPLPASALSVGSAMVFPILFIILLDPLGLDGLWLNMPATSLSVMIMAFVMMIITQKKSSSAFKNSKL